MYNPGSFERRSKQRVLAKRFLVVTNGQKTERDYFDYLNRIAYDVIEVKTNGRGYSLEKMLDDAKAAIQSNDFDCVAIVMDVDEYKSSKKNIKKITDFMKEAEANGIEVYLSNESFEIWLCAHKIAISNKLKKREQAAKAAKEAGMTEGNRGKAVVESEITQENINKAINEVARLRKANKNKRSFFYKPSTDVDLLVRKIILE